MEASPQDVMKERLADTVREIIVRRGLKGVTVRNVAREMGYTPAVVQHHFASKRAMMLFTNDYSMRLATQIVHETSRAHPADVARCVAAYLPLDAQRTANWLVWISYWSLAVADPELAAILQDGLQQSRSFVVERIAAAAPSIDSWSVAANLMNTVQGIAIQAVFDPADWPQERQCELVQRECRRLLAPAPLRRA